jgi:hypothetical protein
MKKLTDKERQSKLLANAICQLLDWQSRQLQLKEDRKVKAMITRQRNLRMNSKRSATD